MLHTIIIIRYLVHPNSKETAVDKLGTPVSPSSSFTRLKHIKLGRKVIHSIQRLQEVAVRKLLVPPKSQGACRPHRVLNLPPVDLPCS